VHMEKKKKRRRTQGTPPPRGTRRLARRKYRGSRATRRTRTPQDDVGRGRKLPGTPRSPTPPAPIPDAARVYLRRRRDRILPRTPHSPTPSPSGPRIPDASCTCTRKTPSDATTARSSPRHASFTPPVPLPEDATGRYGGCNPSRRVS
jgi:hypothetical protein